MSSYVADRHVSPIENLFIKVRSHSLSISCLFQILIAFTCVDRSWLWRVLHFMKTTLAIIQNNTKPLRKTFTMHLQNIVATFYNAT